MTDIRELQARIGAANEKSGFNGAKNIPEELRYLYWGNELLLVASELVEAQDELRHGHPITEEYTSGADNKPEGVPSEMADAVIRLFGIFHEAGIDLETVLLNKLTYNESREFMHGGKKF